ncbi:hypothetical protein [Pyxidicoccus trucidator]|uniref:hypothetical protein n=1 Tax=Pyxidicoccus trucidator TaxID=2709662 RepID=UPI0013D9FAF0|nr:hypothetical protein [Pyxidicoccus trucidator]
MRQVRWGVLGPAVVVVAAAGAWSMRGNAPETATAPPVATEAQAPAELERELRALRAELESLRQGQGRLTRQVESGGSPAAQAVPSPSTEVEALPAASARPGVAELAAAEEARKERMMELDAELEAAVQTEARDTEWAGRTEEQVSGAFRAPELTGSRLTRVDCRTRLCVLEVEHDAPEARKELLDSLLRASGIQGQAVVRPSGDGTRLASRVYLSRAGERLPMTLRR